MKLKLAAAAVVLSSTVSAQDYQWFSDLTLIQNDTAGISTDAFSLFGQYYFDNKTALGPYSEFEYINKTSNVFAHYLNVESGDFYESTIGGEAFLGNVLLGASFSDSKGDDSSNSLSFGYLFNDDFLVRVDRHDGDNMDAYYIISADYNHQLNDTDYVGFSVAIDDETDYLSLSSKYFTHLGNDRYLTLQASYEDFDFDDAWALGASYYFSKATSVSAMFGSEDTVDLGVQHFFNPNVALHFNYTESEFETIDSETVYVGVTAQF